MVSKVMVAHISVGVVAIVLFLFLVFYSCFKKRSPSKKVTHLENGLTHNQLISSLHSQQVSDSGARRPSLHGFRRGASSRQLFCWADHQSLINDAVETGWPRFAFTLSPAIRPTSILGMCAQGEGGNALETELSWEIGHGSVDFMQKIRLNPGMKRSTNPHSFILSVIRTALPLPGPPCAFPEEAYFEVLILSCREEDEDESHKILEGERMKLIKETNRREEHRSSESFVSVSSCWKDEGRGGVGVLFSVGFTVGGLLPMKVPGSYPGSIGFGSNGFVYQDGNKLVTEPEKAEEWGNLTGKVIGCGFIPSQKTVFFTIDSELVHMITCTTDEFGTPLYPTLAANCDITVLVNNGQSPFKYDPANVGRRPNPCFLGNPSKPGDLCEDSKELFSMGRIDAQWHHRSAPRSSVRMGHRDYDEESDMDELFEIILEGNSSTRVGR